MKNLVEVLRKYSSGIVFVSLHLAAVGGVCAVYYLTEFEDLTWKPFVLAGIYFLVAGFGVTGGYHRFFTHKGFKCSRAFRLYLAISGATAFQGSLIEWVPNHRLHHQHSDTAQDPHSPVRRGRFWRHLKGFFWAHIGWILVPRQIDLSLAKDILKVRELRWLSKIHVIPGILVAVIFYWFTGLTGLCLGFFPTIIVLYHLTFSVNSVGHLFGSQTYETDGDSSRDNPVVGALALGEGWHNSHHAFPTSARHGLRWWQPDLTWYILCILAFFGLVWDLRQPTWEEMEAKKRTSEKEFAFN